MLQYLKLNRRQYLFIIIMIIEENTIDQSVIDKNLEGNTYENRNLDFNIK